MCEGQVVKGCGLLQEESGSQGSLDYPGSGATQAVSQPKRRSSGASASALAAETGRQPSQLGLSSPLTSLTVPEVAPTMPLPLCNLQTASRLHAWICMALACEEAA